MTLKEVCRLEEGALVRVKIYGNRWRIGVFWRSSEIKKGAYVVYVSDVRFDVFMKDMRQRSTS